MQFFFGAQRNNNRRFYTIYEKNGRKLKCAATSHFDNFIKCTQMIKSYSIIIIVNNKRRKL